jgi:hypothetical protein
MRFRSACSYFKQLGMDYDPERDLPKLIDERLQSSVETVWSDTVGNCIADFVTDTKNGAALKLGTQNELAVVVKDFLYKRRDVLHSAFHTVPGCELIGAHADVHPKNVTVSVAVDMLWDMCQRHFTKVEDKPDTYVKWGDDNHFVAINVATAPHTIAVYRKGKGKGNAAPPFDPPNNMRKHKRIKSVEDESDDDDGGPPLDLSVHDLSRKMLGVDATQEELDSEERKADTDYNPDEVAHKKRNDRKRKHD